MYNLIVSALFKARDVNDFTIDKSRFLEGTANAIQPQLESVSKQAIEYLSSWPCLVMNEGKADEAAVVAKIESLSSDSKELSVRITPIGITITNATLWKARAALGIDQFEFNRNHWAVKEGSLLRVLSDLQINLPPEAAELFADKKLPIVSRAELMACKGPLAEFSHTDLDDLLMEAGAEGLKPTRIGSRKDRALAIIQYLLEKPDAVTADNELFSFFLLNKVKARVATSAAPLDVDSGSKSGPAVASDAKSKSVSRRVFVVHGRNEKRKSEVAAVLTGAGLEPVILHEQPNMGRHLLTKFIEEAELAKFAVIIMSGDDVGGLSPNSLSRRARQNVILELGYFISHLGQKNVCALRDTDVEAPSDFDGIAYISMDEGGEWRTLLHRELRAVGLLATVAS